MSLSSPKVVLQYPLVRFLTPRNGLGVVAWSLSLVSERAARVRNFVRQSSAKAKETPREELFLPIK